MYGSNVQSKEGERERESLIQIAPNGSYRKAYLMENDQMELHRPICLKNALHKQASLPHSQRGDFHYVDSYSLCEPYLK